MPDKQNSAVNLANNFHVYLFMLITSCTGNLFHLHYKSIIKITCFPSFSLQQLVVHFQPNFWSVIFAEVKK